MPEQVETDEQFEERLALDDEAMTADLGEPRYDPDLRTLWGSEAARAILVVLTRRLGPDFAREVSNELASRTLAYESGCPDDQRDGQAMEVLICDKFWDGLFEMEAISADATITAR